MRLSLDRNKGTWVLLSFIAFFALIVAVNAVFITTALRTHTGVVTLKPYEKGLSYDRTLENARMQPVMQDKASFDNGVMRWVLKDENGEPVDADVTVSLVRPVMSGHDFEMALEPQGQGIYTASPDFPMKGHWQAQFKATWNSTQYQTTLSLMVK